MPLCANPAELEAVEKSFGNVPALRGIDLELRTGERLALLGPNGAGKTTAVRIMLGLRRPDAGRARLFGLEPGDRAAQLRVGVTPQETGFPATLAVREVLDFVRAHFPRPATTSELVASFGLDGLEGRQTGGLSGGQRRRLAVALAFAGRPDAVFLDEPTTGLDMDARRRVWNAIREYSSAGGTVLFTTHYLEEAEALASRIVVLADGRVVRKGTVREVKAGVGFRTVRIRARAIPDHPAIHHRIQEGDSCTLYTRDVDTLVRWLVEHEFSLAELEVRDTSLEETLLELMSTIR